MLLAILSVVIVYKYLQFDGLIEIANTVIGITVLAFLLIVPLLIIRFFKRNVNSLFEKDIEKKYDSLYENVNSHPLAYSYVVLYMIRRLIFAVTL